uniref:Putative amidase n=1 Tax=uncultured marine bacterium HF4000_APKG2098 TaxID=455614 RepID=B3TCQ7_9BACT|nr:putative amidase [uncultured marine bacterium HF4000_APKG2098]
MSSLKLSAVEMVQSLKKGEITSEELVKSYIEQIKKKEKEVEAWEFFDQELVLKQAKKLDELHQSGKHGDLHGIPVGIKDIFDTEDMPTTDGTEIHKKNPSWNDCTVVSKLKQAGAIIMGKTVTAELAYYSPGKTKNPHDTTRTPGGSSSGSAAAVASHMVPLAVGSQTNGSVIRPASYCGVVGYKPTKGLISRHLVLQISRALDQVGVFANSIEDAALISEQLIGHDKQDPDTSLNPRPKLLAASKEKPPAEPVLAHIKLPFINELEEDVKEGFKEIKDELKGKVDEIELPEGFAGIPDWHKIIMESDMARSFSEEYKKSKNKLSDKIIEAIERGMKYTSVEYNNALAKIDVANAYFNQFFHDYDAILTPSACGEAPKGLKSTGNPIFCTIWTYCGMPCINLPLLQGKNGLPVGVQLVSSLFDDERLFRNASWLTSKIKR